MAAFLGRQWTDFHRLDQAVLDRETVTDLFITKNGSVSVAHHLMDLDQNATFSIGLKRDRLDMRIDLGPLFCPVGTDRIVTTNDASLEGARPCDIRGHGGECGCKVARVKRGVSRAEQFYFL